MKLDADDNRFLAILDSAHQWPSLYAFKFIVPSSSAKELEALVPRSEMTEVRSSSGGKYAAYTFHCAMGSGHEVLSVYAKVKSIAGLVSL